MRQSLRGGALLLLRIACCWSPCEIDRLRLSGARSREKAAGRSALIELLASSITSVLLLHPMRKGMSWTLVSGMAEAHQHALAGRCSGPRSSPPSSSPPPLGPQPYVEAEGPASAVGPLACTVLFAASSLPLRLSADTTTPICASGSRAARLDPSNVPHDIHGGGSCVSALTPMTPLTPLIGREGSGAVP